MWMMPLYLHVNQKSYYDDMIKVVIILANSADPDEMQHNAAFHLGLHYLPEYPFRGFQYTKGYSL